MKFKRVSIVFVVMLVIICSSAIAGSSNITAENEIVAIVNDTEITLAEFYETLEDHFGVYILSQIILNTVIEQKQAELGVYVDQELLDTVYSENVQRLGGMANLQNFLSQAGMDHAAYLEQLEFELTIYLLNKAEISVTPEEVEEFFYAHKDYFAQPETVRASHILVETEEEAVKLISKLNSGAKFEDLAREYSSDEQTSVVGGDLGYFPRNYMVPEFEKLAFSLSVGTYNTVKTDYGWHVVLVTDKVEAKDANLDEQWDEVQETLIEYLAWDLDSYVKKLEQQSAIEIVRERYR